MVTGCFSSYLDVCDNSEVTVGEALQKDIWVQLFSPEILEQVKCDLASLVCNSHQFSYDEASVIVLTFDLP